MDPRLTASKVECGERKHLLMNQNIGAHQSSTAGRCVMAWACRAVTNLYG